MDKVATGHNAAVRGDRADPVRSAAEAVVSRLSGPGGYYNIGNVLAITAGLAVQVASVADTAGEDSTALLEAVRVYFVGSPGATALTVAIGIFFVAGGKYNRAWSRGFPPDRRANWWGDFLSGIAAVVLTGALAAFGDVLLACLSGLLLAVGKFGSALVPEDYEAPGANPWPNLFRTAVLVSRVPAVLALAIELAGLLSAGQGAPAGSLVMTAVMLVCYGLWARADLLLFAGRPRVPKPA